MYQCSQCPRISSFSYTQVSSQNEWRQNSPFPPGHSADDTCASATAIAPYKPEAQPWGKTPSQACGPLQTHRSRPDTNTHRWDFWSNFGCTPYTWSCLPRLALTAPGDCGEGCSGEGTRLGGGPRAGPQLPFFGSCWPSLHPTKAMFVLLCMVVHASPSYYKEVYHIFSLHKQSRLICSRYTWAVPFHVNIS